MIFLDTSAIYALADRADDHHQRARRIFERLVAADEPLLTHSYVLVESAALLQHRLGFEPAWRFLEDSEAFEVEWVTRERHEDAVRLWRSARRRGLSLVDAVSFAVIRSRAVRAVFAFDAHFADEGFHVLDA